MADQLKAELQALVGSGNSHKDSVEKYRKIFQRIIALDDKSKVASLQVFIETGKYSKLRMQYSGLS